MTFYVLIFMFCIVMHILHCSVKDENIKRIIEIFTLVVLVFFSGTRYRLGGSDYEMYENMFKAAPTLENFSFFGKYIYGVESGYIFLNSLLKSIGFNFYGFTLFHSFLFYVLLYKALRKYDIDFSFFIIIFLYKSCIFNTFVSMRQSLVIVIFLNALYYLINGNWKKYIIYMILCIFLHRTSIILLPIIFLCNRTFSKRSFIIYGLIFFSFFILNVSNVYIFNPSSFIYSIFGSFIRIVDKTEFYLSGNVFKSINLFSTLETYFIWLIIVIFYNKLYFSIPKERKSIINVFLLIIPLVTLFRSFEVMIRFRDYFSILFPFLIYYISNIFERKSKLIYVMIVFSLAFIGYYRYIYNYGTGKYSLVNYQSYLIKDVSIFEHRN